MESTQNTRKYLYNHTSQENAYVVEDYPWGFRLKTTIRYWIETSKAKNGGQRFCSQTINPKTGKWCAPKKSTYDPILIMFLDENDHLKYCGLDHNSSEEYINIFKEIHIEHLTDYQKLTLKEIISYCEVMKHVNFEFNSVVSEPISLFSKDPIEIAKRQKMLKECEEKEEREKEMLKNISKAIGYEMSKVIL